MTYGRRAHAWGLCALALVLIGCGAAHAAPRVALYMKESTDVLNLRWDAAPANLEAQLNQLGFDVERDQSGQPGGVDAYVIPVQNGNAFYSAAEDMDAIAEYVEEGGLVVVLDSLNGQEEALKTFVSSALNYEGESTWSALFGKRAVKPCIVVRVRTIVGGATCRCIPALRACGCTCHAGHCFLSNPCQQCSGLLASRRSWCGTAPGLEDVPRQTACLRHPAVFECCTR